MTTLVHSALYVTGGFAVVLGVLHFFFPRLFDFEHAIPSEGPPLRPIKLWLWRHALTRADVRGIAMVMNHFASFWILTLGLMDLAWPVWLAAPYGRLVSLWMALAWLVRAGSQRYLGRRRGDIQVMAGFAAIGAVHVAAALL